MQVAIGIDSHKSTLAAAAVDDLGRTLRVRQFPNTIGGHRALTRWAEDRGDQIRFGIESSGAYAMALCRMLVNSDHDVVEVPSFMSQREARREPSKGKADPSDAVAIARVTAREHELPSPARAGVAEDLGLLVAERDVLQRQRTQLINRVHKDLTVLHPGYERRMQRLTTKSSIATARRLLRGHSSVRAELALKRLKEIQRLTVEAEVLKSRIAATVAETGSSLTSLPGVGPLMAATIISEVRDITRFRSAAAFAMFCGVAPLPASSGRTQRHRLNRFCNRKLNRALWVMALTQSRSPGPAHDYIARRLSDGKTRAEAIRCLKRHLANVVYRSLRGSEPRKTDA